jgi:hypothetical protein
VSELDDGLGERCVLVVVEHVGDEALVDLEGVQRQPRRRVSAKSLAGALELGSSLAAGSSQP